METTEKKIADMTIEETFAALDALIDQLESGKGSLEDAFKNYEEGMKLVKSCNEKIEKIEKQILVLGGESMEASAVDRAEMMERAMELFWEKPIFLEGKRHLSNTAAKHLTGVIIVKSCDDAEQGRLAFSAFADQGVNSVISKLVAEIF